MNELLINLRNSINSKEILENENPRKIGNIAEKILDFNNQQKRKGIKILAPKQMLQRLPIALVQVKAQVKAVNTSENLLNKIRQIIYSLYRAREITEPVYGNIMNSGKLQNIMDTIFMNSENSKRSAPFRLSLNISKRINLKRKDKYVALSNHSIYYTWKDIKKSDKNNKFKIQAPALNEKFNYLMDHILYQIFKIILNISLKNQGEKIDNTSIKIYVSKLANRITLKNKRGYYLKLLMP